MSEFEQLTPHEAKCVLIALSFGDPAQVDLPDKDLEHAKEKLRALAAQIEVARENE